MKKLIAALVLLFSLAIPALAQTVPLGPRFVLPYQTVIDPTGVPLNGALLYFYASGTNTPLATYSDPLLTTSNSNPVAANAAGVFPNIFLNGNYKVVLTDSSLNQIWTADPVYSSGVGNINVVGTPTANQIPVFNGTANQVAPTTVGGEGGFFDTICSSTIGQIWVRLSSGWGCTSLGYANPVWWGADPTGTTDSTSAFNSAAAASTFIQFPPGKFQFSSSLSVTLPNALASLTIQGAGQDVTILYFPTAANGLMINAANVLNSVHVRDLSITTGVVGASGSGLTLSNSIALGNVLGSDVSHVWVGGDDRAGVDYWTYGITNNSWSSVTYESDTFYGPAAGTSGNGLVLNGTSGTTPIIENISHSNFYNLSDGLVIGAYVQGVTVFQDVFAGTSQTGINIPGSESGLDQLTIIGSEFNTSSNDIISTSSPMTYLRLPEIFLQLTHQPMATALLSAHRQAARQVQSTPTSLTPCPSALICYPARSIRMFKAIRLRPIRRQSLTLAAATSSPTISATILSA